MRKEKDFLGEMEIPTGALYGIHSARAAVNFPVNQSFYLEWFKAMGLVKQACYNTCLRFNEATRKRYPADDLPIQLVAPDILVAMQEAAAEIAAGGHFEHFIVPAISGGAGTSINMNVNEIVANVALIKLGHRPGEYNIIDPIEQANIFQSTNDVVPTALKIAIMFLLREVEAKINNLRTQVEKLERENRDVLRIGYTQMQEAVPTSFGNMFGAWSEAFSRDWWRISKCTERIKVVNLGGGAIGTGVTMPRFYIMEVVQNLRHLTGLPVTRSENLADTTSNLDVMVEAHAVMKAFAVNLEKFVSDLRLLASDLSESHLLSLPARQAGSSIMPGKVNPVIAEYIISCSHQIYSNDQLITNLCAQGCLELNAYLPAIGHAMIGSLNLLAGMSTTLTENLLKDLGVNHEVSVEKLLHCPSITTALLPYIGYHQAGELARLMKSRKYSIYEANEDFGLLKPDKLKEILQPSNLLKLGYTLSDIIE